MNNTNGFSVKINYKNKNLEDVDTREYGLKEYVDCLKIDITRIIMDVEDAIEHLTDNKPKSEWDEITAANFQKIRHRLLDSANSVSRIPENLYYNGVPCKTVPAGRVIGDIVNYITDNK